MNNENDQESRTTRDPGYETEKVHSSIKPLILAFLQELMKNYWSLLYNYVNENPDLIKSVPGFLMNPEKVGVRGLLAGIVYWIPFHLPYCRTSSPRYFFRFLPYLSRAGPRSVSPPFFI